MAKAKIKNTNNAIFERHEKKYLINREKFNHLLDFFKEYMEEDSYGLHTINSIYYDTDDYKIVRNSINKPKFREKLRLRSYGTPKSIDTVYLELKKKLNGITYKRRIPLSLKEAEAYMNNHIKPSELGQIFEEIDWFVSEESLKAKVLISYDRLALFGKSDNDFRITFDMNIRFRDYNLSLGKGDNGQLLLNDSSIIMEIKTLDSFPLWLTRYLSENNIFPNSFSKYGNIYKWHLVNKEEFSYVG